MDKYFGTVVKKNDVYFCGCVDEILSSTLKHGWTLGYAITPRHEEYTDVEKYCEEHPENVYEYADFINRCNLVGYALTFYKEMKDMDYIGIKIAMGRATKEDYAVEIARQEAVAKTVESIKARLEDRTPLTPEEVAELIIVKYDTIEEQGE